jgi:hypothetical protein
VFPALQKLGYSQLESQAIMEGVSFEAIQAHPWRYCTSRCRRFVWFWITPNGTFRPTPELAPPPETLLPPGDQPPAPHRLAEMEQHRWRGAWYFDRGRLDWLFHPSAVLYAASACAAFVAVGILLWDRRQRILGIALGLWLLYFSVVTVLAACAEYRYRMVLEPAMVVAVASAIVVFLHKNHMPAGATPEGQPA